MALQKRWAEFRRAQKLKWPPSITSEKQVFTYFIQWSPSGPDFLMHLGGKIIYGDHQFLFQKMHFAFGRKSQKSKMVASGLLNKIDYYLKIS